MSNFDTPADIVADVLFRMDEAADSPDFLAPVQRSLVRAAHDFANKHPWPWDRKYPPGAFITVEDINTTLTLATPGDGGVIAATLGTGSATSYVGRKILPVGRNYFMRVTGHTTTGPGTSITVDAAPLALTNEPIIIVKDEYLLASDLGLFVDGLWTEDGFFIPLRQEEWIRKEFGDRPDPSWPPSGFCRLDTRRIRLSHYPTEVKRVEYPYNTMPDDLDATDDSTELNIPHNFRWLLSDATLYFCYLLKSDKRAPTAQADYAKAIEDCLSYARRMMVGIGTNPGSGPRAPYQ